MKIAIISDIHDNHKNLDICLDWCGANKIKDLICCGDVANSETLKKIGAYGGSIHLVRGNAEVYEEELVKKYDNIIYYGKFGRTRIGDKDIGLCHEPIFIKKVKEQGKCDIVFYGHLHTPWEGERDGVRSVNPGYLGDRFMPGTFAVYDTSDNEMELITTNTI